MREKKENTTTNEIYANFMKLWIFCQNLDSIRRQYFSGVMMKNRAIMHGIFKS